MAYKELNKVILMPSCINNVHESCFRSYHILEYVLGMVSREDSKETIIDMAAFLKELPEPENKASNTGNEFEQARRNPIERDGNFKNSAPKKEVLKDWEILTCNKNGDIHKFVPEDNNERISNCVMDKCSIHSVKRLSDGVVFSVGETVLWDDKPMLINGFEISYGNGSVRSAMMFYTAKSNNFNIYYAKKLPTPTEQTKSDILFTTEQYKEIWDMIFSQNGFPPNHPKTKRNK